MPELLLPRLKREIHARLAELRPLVAEAEQLEAAKRALLEEITQPPAEPEPVRPRRKVAPSSILPRPAADTLGAAARTRGSRSRSAAREEAPAPSGGPRETIVALVEERPGVSVAEIAAVTKIPKPTVASTVSKLKRDGVLADEAGGVKLASRKPLTLAEAAAVAARDEGVSDAEWDAASPAPSGAAA